MEKFKLFVEYQVAKTTYVTNLFETEHFRMHCKAFRDHIKLTMQTPIPVRIHKLQITIPYTFDRDDRLFFERLSVLDGLPRTVRGR